VIRHALDPAALRADIEMEDANWFTKATKRAKKLAKLGMFEEKSSIWSSAKPAFMLLQSNKCAFCERPFSGPNESRIEMDLEHFRPKSAIAAWTPPPGPKRYPAELGAPSPNGYFWLAYETSNYAAACKICNSDYKAACFPIAGPRCVDPADPAALAAERPYLVYPIGTADDDPEDLITFTGTIARPVVPGGLRHSRAALIIDFFGLNTRDQLHIQRAETIERFGNALIAVSDGVAVPADHTYVAQIQNPLIPHAGCLRAFKRLWDQDEPAARRLYNACRNMLANRLVDPAAKGLGVGFE
jgi:hypothetical protein